MGTVYVTRIDKSHNIMGLSYDIMTLIQHMQERFIQMEEPENGCSDVKFTSHKVSFFVLYKM